LTHDIDVSAASNIALGCGTIAVFAGARREERKLQREELEEACGT
jgi:hypothetical protein